MENSAPIIGLRLKRLCLKLTRAYPRDMRENIYIEFLTDTHG